MRKRKEGFTLVELLIVMAVIAALMGALVPVALNAINHANATRVAENLRAIQSAVQNYAYSEHEIPDLNTLITGNYITGHISNTDYGIYYATGTNNPTSAPLSKINDATVTVYIVYDGSVDGKLINKAWPEATDTKPTGLSDNNFKACVKTVIAKYW